MDSIKKYHQIIDEAYANYENEVRNSIDKATEEGILKGNQCEYYSIMGKQTFIHRIKTDDKFSNQFKLKIKERELSLTERRNLVTPQMHGQIYNAGDSSTLSHSEIDQWDIPRKEIIVKYYSVNGIGEIEHKISISPEKNNLKMYTLETAQEELIELLESQIMDLTAMSRIELGDDVITEIKRLKSEIEQAKQ